MTRSIAMPKLKLIVQELQSEKSYKEIARLASVSKALVGKIAKKLQAYEQNLSNLDTVDDQTLRELIYPPRAIKPNEPNWNHVHCLLSKSRVTIDTVYHDDYLPSLSTQCEPMAYSTFCQHYQQWREKNGFVGKVGTNFVNVPGEKMEIDFSGDKLTWVDPWGEIHQAEMFVATLPASQMFFVAVTEHQRTEDWILGINAALQYFGAVPKVLSMDNAKALVTDPNRFDASFTLSIQDLCGHYGMSHSAAPPLSPKSKNRVEAGVNWAQMWVEARLNLHDIVKARDLEHLQELVLQKVNEGNDRPFTNQKTKISRRQFFEQYERKELKPLPTEPYELCEWKTLRVDERHCIRISSDGGHRYSTPSAYIKKNVNVRIGQHSIRIYDADNGMCLGTHNRHFNDREGKTHILPEHLTPMEKKLREGPTWFINAMVKVGVNRLLSENFFTALFDEYNNDMNARKGASGILHCTKTCNDLAVIERCMRICLEQEEVNYQHFKKLLDILLTETQMHTRRMQRELLESDIDPNYQTPEHKNIRYN